MWRAGAYAFLAVATLGQGVHANAPATSLIPQLRPGSSSLDAVRTTTVPVFYNASIRPQLRPGTASAAAPAAQPAVPVPVVSTAGFVSASVPGVSRSLIPQLRPANLSTRVAQASPAAAPQSETRAERRRRERAERQAERARSNQPRRGSVCGDRAIRGEQVASIAGTQRGCGVSSPVRITEVDGVTLSSPATINCDTAQALKTWINEGVRPAVGRLGGGVESLRVVASYSCRTRNNQPGARISEHGKGNAIDIAGIRLQNGVEISVLNGWRENPQRQMLRNMHRAACGPFGTVLGPDADRYHQDHFHFDVARHRSGAYCR